MVWLLRFLLRMRAYPAHRQPATLCTISAPAAASVNHFATIARTQRSTYQHVHSVSMFMVCACQPSFCAPQVQPAPDDVYPSRDMAKVFDAASKAQKDKGDAYLGVDVLLSAVLAAPDVGTALSEAGE